MTTPQPPGVEFNFLSRAAPPAYGRLFRICLVADIEGGVDPANPIIAGQVFGPYNDLAHVDGVVGDGSDAHYAAKALFDNDITPDIWIAHQPDPFDIDETIAAIARVNRINPPVDFIYLVNTSSGGYEAPAVANLATVEAQLAVTCEQLDCIGVMDSPAFSEIQYNIWVTAAATRPQGRVRPVFNRVNVGTAAVPNYRGAGGWFLGAALRQASRFGRQAGINTISALGVGELETHLSNSLIGTVDSDVKTLVNNYGSAVFLGDRGFEIIGDVFLEPEEDDPLRYWSSRLVVDYATSQMRLAVAPHVGDDRVGNTPAYRRGLARHANEAADQLVINGELLNARVRPHPSRNNQAARQARVVHLQAFLTVILATNSAVVEVNISI